MLQFSAVDLQSLLSLYETDILPYEFIYDLADGRQLRLTFEQSQLAHLLGIQKVDHSRADLKGQLCFDQMKSGCLTFQKLKSINRHAVARECKDKIRYFDELPALLAHPQCVSYDPASAGRPSRVRMSFALYGHDGKVMRRLILGIDQEPIVPQDDQLFFPRTWLIEKLGQPSLLDGQISIPVVHAQKKRRSL